MNLEEACELAQQIERNTVFKVLAIGHFVAPDDFHPQLPWGISVRSSQQSKFTVIWSRTEWEELQGSLECRLQPPESQRVEDRLKPTLQQDKRRDAKHRQQMNLF